MSVRRLSKTQPAAFAFNEASQELANWWIAKYPQGRQASAVIPLLWVVQKQEGWVSEPAIRYVADLLGMAVIRVFEVATFYTMFQLEPVGDVAFVQLCGTTPCMLRGANDLKGVCEAKIGPKNHRSADGKFSWEEVECLGACSNAPMVAINDYYYEDLTPESFGAILDAFARGEKPEPGSAVGRTASEPHEAVKTLTEASLYDGSRAAKIERLPNAPEPEAQATA